MQAIENNNQKYNNYKTQMGRLYKAQKAEFFLEAIFIEDLDEVIISSIKTGYTNSYPISDCFIEN